MFGVNLVKVGSVVLVELVNAYIHTVHKHLLNPCFALKKPKMDICTENSEPILYNIFFSTTVYVPKSNFNQNSYVFPTEYKISS